MHDYDEKSRAHSNYDDVSLSVAIVGDRLYVPFLH